MRVDENNALALAAKDSPEALAKLIEECDDLIVGAVIRYRGVVGCDLDDLKQYGRIALIEAVERFDQTRGPSFSGFAYQIVWMRVRQWVTDECLTIRVPNHWTRNIGIKRFRNPGRIVDHAAKSPVDEADARLLVQRANDRIRHIPTKWREIFEMRLLGFTSREVGHKFGISHARVGQIISRVTKKLNCCEPEALQTQRRGKNRKPQKRSEFRHDYYKPRKRKAV